MQLWQIILAYEGKKKAGRWLLTTYECSKYQMYHECSLLHSPIRNYIVALNLWFVCATLNRLRRQPMKLFGKGQPVIRWSICLPSSISQLDQQLLWCKMTVPFWYKRLQQYNDSSLISVSVWPHVHTNAGETELHQSENPCTFAHNRVISRTRPYRSVRWEWVNLDNEMRGSPRRGGWNFTGQHNTGLFLLDREFWQDYCKKKKMRESGNLRADASLARRTSPECEETSRSRRAGNLCKH